MRIILRVYLLALVFTSQAQADCLTGQTCSVKLVSAACTTYQFLSETVVMAGQKSVSNEDLEKFMTASECLLVMKGDTVKVVARGEINAVKVKVHGKSETYWMFKSSID